MDANTLFLRLEGPMQAWGNQQSKFVIRRTAEAPTKSGVIGLLCAAMGVSRKEAPEKWLPIFNTLHMGVRIDKPGFRWWDYHTVGARMKMHTAEGTPKDGAMLTRQEYLCDASFLVIMQGNPEVIDILLGAMKNPMWTPYLGRKACPPSRPLLESIPTGDFQDIISAMRFVPWRPRLAEDKYPDTLDCLLDWESTPEEREAPIDALIQYDVPLTFDPPSHGPRYVIRRKLLVGSNGEISISEKPTQKSTPAPFRPRADYRNSEYQKRRSERLKYDHHLCVFCKSPATTVQHITYRHAGGNESEDDLRSLCRLCHDAVTMIEYGHGMGLERINPEDPKWRDSIIRTRAEIIQYRSLETRRRKLSKEEV